MEQFKNKLSYYQNIINEYLEGVINPCGTQKEIVDAMNYSLTAPGKRIRPCMVLAVAEANGADISSALPFAAALEMIHAYSLIHDDLPGMDNDSLRRGRPTNHIVFGEGMAILAGDALLTQAFSVIAESDATDSQKVAAVKELSHHAGIYGMIGGQVIDLKGEKETLSPDEIYLLNKQKTADLFMAAVSLGAIVSGADIECYTRYAECMGVAFQLKDDLLDIEADEKTLGKSQSDKDNNKSTLLSVWGTEKTRAELLRLTDEARACLDNGRDTDDLFLHKLLDYLVVRNK